MDLWLRLLVDPGSILASRSEYSTERVGLALLLDGEFLQYTRTAAENRLPSLVGPPAKREDGDRALLAALVAILRADLEVGNLFSKLLDPADNTASRAALAGVLASIDAGGRRDSVEALRILERIRPPTRGWEIVIKLHQGVRLAEIDRPQDRSRKLREQAIQLIDQKGRRSGVNRYLAWTAHSNQFHFAFMSGQLQQPELEAPLGSEAISDVDQNVRQALAAYLDGNFLESFRDIRVRSMSFSAEDPVTSRLDAAVLRAECLADWQLLSSVRRWQRSMAAIEFPWENRFQS